MRPLRTILLLLAVALVTVAGAHAQIGIYGQFALTHYEDTSNNDTTSVFYGGQAGIYDDFLHLGPIRVGADLRGSVESGNNFRYKTVLGGVRVALKLPLIGVRPYVQGSIGAGNETYTGGSLLGGGSDSKLLYEVFGGVDKRLLPHIDFRVVELGYGQQSGTGGYPSSLKSNLFLISTGVVIRL